MYRLTNYQQATYTYSITIILIHLKSSYDLCCCTHVCVYYSLYDNTSVMQSEWFSNIKHRICTGMLCLNYKRDFSVNDSVHQVKSFNPVKKIKKLLFNVCNFIVIHSLGRIINIFIINKKMKCLSNWFFVFFRNLRRLIHRANYCTYFIL